MKKIAAFIASGTEMITDSAKYLALKGFDIAIMSPSGKGESLANNHGGYGFTGSNFIPDDINKFINNTINKYNKRGIYITSQNIRVDGDITRSV